MISPTLLVPFIDTPEKLTAVKRSYFNCLSWVGRPFTPMSATKVPDPGWPFNSGGEGNQQDDPLRHFLAWWFYGDKFALQTGLNILSYLAENLTGTKHTYQNGHGQRHPNFGVGALLAKEMGDESLFKKLIDAEIKLYSLQLGSKEWNSEGPTTFRPGCRHVSTTARLIHDILILQKAGYIHPDQFKGNEPEKLLVRLLTWVHKWFWRMQSAEGGEGWTVAPGLYRYDEKETDWLYWSMKTSDSEEDHVTAFMHYSLFPRDIGIALVWLEKMLSQDTVRLWTKRAQDMATWALAVAYSSVSGRARRAQDWSPEILEARGPFSGYDSDETGERTHSLAMTFGFTRASQKRRKLELENCLKRGMKLPQGEVDEGLAITALRLGYGD